MGLAGKMDARRLPFYYGWVVFAVTFLIYAFMYGLRYSIGVFFTPIQQEFGWSTATTASAVTVFFWVYALAAPIVGSLAARIGVRKTVLIGGLLLGGGGALVSQVQELWQLYLYWGVLAAFGAAALYVIPTMVLSRFFLRKRGRAVGWASVGVSVGQAILVPLVGVAIQAYGWRAAILGLGSVVVVVTSVVGYLFLREDPESMGLHVDGVEPDAPLEGSEPVIAEPEEYQEPRVALTSSTFRLIVLSYFFAIGGIISILTFVVPHMIRMGLTPIQASGAFGVIGAMSAVGSFLFGFASDRLGRKTTILVTTIGIAVSFFVASVLPPDLTLLYAWAVLYGLTYGGCPEQYAALISDYYGNRHATTLFGFLTLGGGIGGGLFPLIGGWLVDLTGAYFWTLILLGCSMCAAALMILAAPPPES
ncbi:MAG: MFS transporter [Candidatus Bathyarchaeota archaeon]|nr:MFS transporter [Candidatus Bathyarchaeota archaeon]